MEILKAARKEHYLVEPKGTTKAGRMVRQMVAKRGHRLVDNLDTQLVAHAAVWKAEKLVAQKEIQTAAMSGKTMAATTGNNSVA